MRLGIGSGSTIKFLIDWLKEKVANGELKDIRCIPTSYQTRKWLNDARLQVESLETLNILDLTIDGADEMDHSLTCIKGGGGCLMQEKIVQSCADKFILIGDHEKLSNTLGEKFKRIPIEVIPYGCDPVKRWIEERQGGYCVLRMDQRGCFPVITENHNYIFDWHFPVASQNTDWVKVHHSLVTIPGVVETGLFVNVAKLAYLGSPDGQIRCVEAKQ